MPTLPFLIISLTPSSQKRSKKRPTYQYHMVPRAGGSSHCQPRTPFGSSLPVGYRNHGDQQVPPYHRRACLPAAQGSGGGRRQPAAERSGSLYRGLWGADGRLTSEAEVPGPPSNFLFFAQ